MKEKKKSDALPESISDNDKLIQYVKDAVEARTRKGVADKDEKTARKDMSLLAEDIRTDALNYNGDFIGVIKVIEKNIPATRIEFRINNGALDVSQMDTLNELFGGLRPALFAQAKVVKEITDPDKLIDEMSSGGLNPWDYLELKVKPEKDDIVSTFKGIVTAEAILPKKGLLARLSENSNTLSRKAVDWIKVYLEKALKPTPVLGTK